MRAWDGLRGINDHSEADHHLAYFPRGDVLQLANGLEAFIDAGVAHGNLRADLGRRLCFALFLELHATRRCSSSRPRQSRLMVAISR